VLYSFCAEINCTDGNSPRAGLISDSSGNLYGTTEFGGAYEEGTVFKLAPDGTETVLYSFCAEINCTDGAYPLAGLIMDAAGNLYGMAPNGGTYGGGTVFRLAPDGTETVLYSFCAQTNCTDGGGPTGLIADSSGNLYGTTGRGGEGDCKYGCGTVFKLAPDGTETVLHAFNGGSDGRTPLAGVIADNAGNLYGTTFYGGGTRCHSGCGTVFKLAPDGTETVLFAFHGRRGTNPAGALLKSPHGLLYGTTQFGGASGSYGTIFKIKK
jgi:uncharacterized repeat protein (TIGR03803 family)